MLHDACAVCTTVDFLQRKEVSPSSARLVSETLLYDTVDEEYRHSTVTSECLRSYGSAPCLILP